MKQIELTFKADGSPTEIKAIGFKGKGCQDATKIYEEGLGTVTNDTKTPEFYQTTNAVQKLKT